MKLYEITKALRHIEQEIADEGGELNEKTKSLLQDLDQTLDNFEGKVEQVALVISENERTEEAIRAEIQRLQKKAQTHANTAKRLREYLLENLRAADVQRVDGTLKKVRIQESPKPSFEWTGKETAIPKEIRRVKIELDRNACYELWMAGTLKKYRSLEIQRKKGLRIW